MSRRITGQGASLTSALSDAVASLLDVDAEKVRLDLDAPGVDGVEGGLILELRVESPAEDAERAPAMSRDASEQDSPQDEASPADVLAELDEEADAAADFLEGLLDALDLPGDLRIKVHEDHVELEVVEIGSGALIGRRGQTLEAIQELVRCSLQRQFQRRARVKVDAEGYRARRLEKLIEKTEEAIDLVLDSGEAERLEPMDVFERKTVHQLVAEVDGVESRSQGREPSRRVVIEPA
ncbi:MAG: KH domain-containing protein [Nitriliruptoraceae bacterium]|nr:KH domain-containing protein [Nitriliruptoraceae bacterium]